MEPRRLKYLHVLKSRAPTALRRPVESCKIRQTAACPQAPRCATTPLTRRGRLARAALHGRAPGPLPSCPRGQHAAWRRRVGSIRATTRREPPSAVSRSRHAARARAVARRAEPPAYVTRRVRERRAARRAVRVPERRPDSSGARWCSRSMKSAGAVRGRRTPFIQRREDRRAAVAAVRVHALARRGGLGMGRASPALGQNEGSQGSSLAASEYAWN